MIKKLAANYRAVKFNFIIPESIGDFCEANRLAWRKFLGNRPDSEREEFSILVDGMQDQPAHLMKMGVVSNALRKTKGHETIWVTKTSALDRKSRRVMNSYGGRIKTLRAYLSPVMLLRSLIESVSIFLGLKSVEDTLKITYRGVLIGDLIYDSYVRETGLGTIFKKDLYLYKKITEALFLFKWYERLIKKTRARYIVVAHLVYNLTGVLGRVALKRGAVGYSPAGQGNGLTVRKYISFDDAGKYQKKISEELFNEIYRNRLDLAKKHMDGYFAERTSGSVPDTDAQNAYGGGKGVYTKPELAGLLGIDPGKPFVYIMSHAMPDAPHSNRWYLFNDHYDWVYDTLVHIEKLTGVNWILKDHPSDRMFNSKNNLKTVCGKLYRDKLPGHMVFLPPDVNTKTVLDTADGLITGYGTIGIEASCFGIKCLLAGEAPYSGLGFTFDPRTRDEYYHYLSTLFDKSNIQMVDVDRAKAAAFIYFKHMVVTFGLIPQMSAFRTDRETEKAIYAEAEELLGKGPLSEDYGVNRILDYFRSGAVQLTNSFDIYKDE